MPPEAFAHATYREVFATVRGASYRRKADLRQAIIGAWHTEAFARQKRLPPLNDILRRLDGPSAIKPMTPKQLRMAGMQIAAAFGGRFVDKRKDA